MTLDDISHDARLEHLGIELPEVPRPIANFVPWRRHGDLVFLAGQVCEWNGELLYRGKIGIDHDLAAGKQAARVCALNLLAALRAALGGTLESVTGCLRLGGFVNCVPNFARVPHVIDGASDTMAALFGPKIGAHARTAVGVATLPQCAAVEVDAIFVVG